MMTANDNASQIAAAERTAAAVKAENARLDRVAAGHWTGAKYQHGRNIAEIAKDIRADLKAAAKSGALCGIKAFVRISRYSMGQSLMIRITEIPAGVVVLSTRRIREDMGLVADGKGMTPWRSSDGAAIIKAVEAIANAYNFDKSDLATDYHNSAFHVDVEFASELEDAQRAQIKATIRAACA